MGTGEDKIYRRFAAPITVLSPPLAPLPVLVFDLVLANFFSSDRLAGPILTSLSPFLDQTRFSHYSHTFPVDQAIFLPYPCILQQSATRLPRFTSSFPHQHSS